MLLVILSKYVSLSLGLHYRDSNWPMDHLLDLCRSELHLAFLEIVNDAGQSLLTSGSRSVDRSVEEFALSPMIERHIKVHYQFAYEPEELERGDVAACLASIFNQFRLVATIH